MSTAIFLAIAISSPLLLQLPCINLTTNQHQLLLEQKSYILYMSRCQASLLDCQLTRKDYLEINFFPDLVILEQEGNFYSLQWKATGGATNKVVRETAGRTQQT